MSVYTTVEPAQLETFLERYDLGNLQQLTPVAEGITNTNYRVDTEAGAFVLTLYEHHSDDELDYILGLQNHLAQCEIRCAAPIVDRRGELYSTLNQRPAAIIQRLPGRVVTEPGVEHCALIANELALFHLAGMRYSRHRPNPRGPDWLEAVRDMLDAELDDGDRRLIERCLRDYRHSALADLPGGAIHADLFHDNALFVNSELGGIFDFDYACYDSFILDLAILLNDWCIDRGGDLDPARTAAVLEAYGVQRQLESLELQMLPLMLRFGALRFWLSRLHDQSFPLSGELTFVKCPLEFRKMLERRSLQATELGRFLQSI